MSDHFDFEAIQQQALASLKEGDPEEAFGHIRAVIAYDSPATDSQWLEGMRIFQLTAAQLADEQWAANVEAVVEQPDDVQSLYELGYQLIDERLNDIAASVLHRANTINPGVEGLLSELVCALEGIGAHFDACEALRGAPLVLSNSPLCQYLLAFNMLMLGKLDAAVDLRHQVAHNEELQPILEQLDGMLTRAATIREATPLSNVDLRGWHFVTTGALLLHLSPYGLDEPMHGRYAFVQDQPAICAEGMHRLANALNDWSLSPPRVFALPGRESGALAIALARFLEAPVERWPDGGDQRPGLIVAYDLSRQESQIMETLVDHRPGQILWSHAACWTDEPPFSADIVTFLYQTNISPWDEGRLHVEDGDEVEMLPAYEGTAEMLAEQILAAEIDPSAWDHDPLEQITPLAKAMQQVQGGAALGALRSCGTRRRQRTESPVSSASFL